MKFSRAGKDPENLQNLDLVASQSWIVYPTPKVWTLLIPEVTPGLPVPTLLVQITTVKKHMLVELDTETEEFYKILT